MVMRTAKRSGGKLTLKKNVPVVAAVPALVQVRAILWLSFGLKNTRSM